MAEGIALVLTPTLARPTAAPSAASPSTTALGRRAVAWLALILTLALAVRLHHLASRSLWEDEFCSVECSAGHGLAHEHLPADAPLPHPLPDLVGLADAGPWPRMWSSMDDDNHPPAYFLALRAWRALAGSSDGSLRALSVLCSLAALALAFDAVRVGLGTGPALFVAATLAVAAPQVVYAQQVRNYAPLMMFAAGLASAAVRVEHRGPTPRRLVALWAMAVGGVLSHYYGVAPALAVGVYAAVQLRGRRRTLTLVALTLAAVACAATLGPVLVRQAHAVAGNNAWEVDARTGYAWRLLGLAGSLPVKLVSERLAAHLPVPALWCVLYLLPVPLLRRRRELLFWYVWWVVPVVFVAAIDVHRHALQLKWVRYTFAGSPGLFALVVALPPASAVAARRWVGGVLVALGVAVLPWAVPATPDYHRLATLLAADARPGDVLVVGGTGPFAWRARCMELALTWYTGRSFPADLVILDGRAEPALAARLSRYRRCWVATPLEMGVPDLLPTAAPAGPEARVLLTGKIQQMTIGPDRP